MAGPTITITNLEAFRAELKRAQDAVEDLTIPLTLIGKQYMRGNKAIFALKGPGKYDDLSPRYKKRKEKDFGFVYPILKANGFLEKSITDPTDENAILEVVNKNTLVVGTRVRSKGDAPYPVFLHFGTRYMPARPVLVLDPEGGRYARWANILNEYVLKSLGAPGTSVQKRVPEVSE